MAYAVDAVDAVDTVYTIQTALHCSNMYAYIVKKVRMLLEWDGGLLSKKWSGWNGLEWSGWMNGYPLNDLWC